MSASRKMISLERIFKNGFINFWRNIWLSVAAIAMMLITLTILLFAVVANATFSNTIADVTSKIDVSVYLKDSVTDDQRDSLINQLYKIENVKSITYINKTEALKEYQKISAGNTDLLNAISQIENPLPASLKIKPKDPNKLETLKEFIDKPDILALQSYPTSYSGERKAAIDNITSATRFFQQAGVAGIIVFVFISMLIIFNTIRMAIFNRRDELIIMRLLGASTAYIRGPFIVETMLYGLVAAILSVAAVAALFRVATETLKASGLGLLDINYANTYFSNRLWQILTIQILAGIIIGAVSSLIATRRYLKHHK